MVSPSDPGAERILAIDIGATNIKFCHVDDRGQLLESIRRRLTPYPCTPIRLVDLLSARIQRSQSRRVGVGFPGELVDGRVVRPGNLSRPGGVKTEIDPELYRQWSDFDLQGELRQRTRRDVRLVNDATMAAYGSCVGSGTELVLTLGTAFGLALERNGVLVKVRDVGTEPFVDGRTCDGALGERSRAADEMTWHALVHRAVAQFAREFGADIVHLAGGNARRIVTQSVLALDYRIVIEGNEAPLRGAARLFYD